jgi:hypothetical protein
VQMHIVMPQKKEISQFSLQIEQFVRDKNIPYIEAVVMFCEERDFELEVAAKLISGTLKAKIKMEAEKLNCLPKPKTRKLPIKCK